MDIFCLLLIILFVIFIAITVIGNKIILKLDEIIKLLKNYKKQI